MSPNRTDKVISAIYLALSFKIVCTCACVLTLIFFNPNLVLPQCLYYKVVVFFLPRSTLLFILVHLTNIARQGILLWLDKFYKVSLYGRAYLNQFSRAGLNLVASLVSMESADIKRDCIKYPHFSCGLGLFHQYCPSLHNHFRVNASLTKDINNIF